MKDGFIRIIRVIRVPPESVKSFLKSTKMLSGLRLLIFEGHPTCLRPGPGYPKLETSG